MRIRDYQKLRWFPLFCTQLKHLLSVGIPLGSAVDILHRDAQNPTYKSDLSRLRQTLLDGQSFEQAITHLLPGLNIRPITKIPDIPLFLEETGAYFSTKLTTLRQTGKRLTYPAFLLSTVLSTLITFLVVILPMYNRFYEDMNIPIPAVLSLCLTARHFLAQYGVVTLLGALAIGLVFGKSALTRLRHAVMNALFGFSAADILWMISIYLKNGTDLKTALAGLQPPNPGWTEKIEAFKSKVLKTGLFTSSFATTFKLSNYHAELMHNAEKTSGLHDTLSHIAKEIRDQNQARLESKLAAIAPVIMIALGLFIFIFVYFTFMPIIGSMSLIT